MLLSHNGFDVDRKLASRVDGIDVILTAHTHDALPAVVTVSNELGDPRYPKLKQIMQAARKTVTKWSAADLGLDLSTVGAAGSRLKLERLFVPEVSGEVELIEGETAQEQAAGLVAKLREAKIL